MRLLQMPLTTALSVAMLSLPAVIPQAHAGKTRDAIAAGLIGAAIVAAASKHHRHHQKFSYDGYEPYPPDEYDNRWNDAYSPAAGIVCYRTQVACYKANGHFSAAWTRMQFSDGE